MAWRNRRGPPGFRIPACAGMTVGVDGRNDGGAMGRKPPGAAGVPDSGLRRNDGGGRDAPEYRNDDAAERPPNS